MKKIGLLCMMLVIAVLITALPVFAAETEVDDPGLAVDWGDATHQPNNPGNTGVNDSPAQDRDYLEPGCFTLGPEVELPDDYEDEDYSGGGSDDETSSEAASVAAPNVNPAFLYYDCGWTIVYCPSDEAVIICLRNPDGSCQSRTFAYNAMYGEWLLIE